MRKLLATAVVASIMCSCRSTDAPAPGRPAGSAGVTSGFIHRIIYGRDENGNRVEGRHKKIWFTEHSTRWETIEGAIVLGVSVDGPTGWVAYPGAGRIRRHPQGGVHKAYAEGVRRIFERLFSSRTPDGAETLHGLPCHRYSWHEEAAKHGCVGEPEQDVTFWVHADPRLPVILKAKRSAGPESEVVAITLNTPIADEVFREPDGLTPLIPFRLPSGELLIEIRMERFSDVYGWRSVTKESFSRIGDVVVYSREGISTGRKRKRSKLPSVRKKLTPEKASMEISGRLTPDLLDLSVMKKVGRESLLNLDADILVTVSEAYGDRTWWIADHPVLGTVVLKRIVKYETQESVTAITTLVAEDKPDD